MRSSSATVAAVGFGITVLACTVGAPHPPAPAGARGPVDFATEVRPLLSDRCFVCHGLFGQGGYAIIGNTGQLSTALPHIYRTLVN